MKEVLDRLREILASRQQAYQLVFGGETGPVKAVMDDLRRFCRDEESCFHADPRIHAALEGRREVFIRIEKHLKLTPEQFWKYYGKKETE